MFHVILYEPEIPPNTGNIMRLCANAGAQLHLVGVLGFHLSDARLRRAGLDYIDRESIHRHPDWRTFRKTRLVDRCWAFSSRAGKRYDTPRYRSGDGLLFGPESRGLPGELLDELGPNRCLQIPMHAAGRSLNLSNSVAVALFEAWRQLDFAGAARSNSPG